MHTNWLFGDRFINKEIQGRLEIIKKAIFVSKADLV